MNGTDRGQLGETALLYIPDPAPTTIPADSNACICHFRSKPEAWQTKVRQFDFYWTGERTERRGRSRGCGSMVYGLFRDSVVRCFCASCQTPGSLFVSLRPVGEPEWVLSVLGLEKWVRSFRRPGRQQSEILSFSSTVWSNFEKQASDYKTAEKDPIR